ncbi:hypothetical protein PUNSTDRAFT_110579 [Punctularia strigosozonata HHB-11173 SS5]|uniref:uncharacterized protein n=1 Tax=Punctularia strigosozonata (strain HHB-11173) TaxID=741275 RepID=UPI0004416646|nr:uncharacterized protein PUNSTDRAFT_110579 [Punctularia strigosozonata HHB-11173 SS5]EIN14497.1 hypothetical protein PUNSTDRAFT_110579 [Punctularia strigosozonata HHB-11173 SS5]
MEQRWEEKNLRREEKDNQLSELKEMVEQLVEDRNAARARWEAEQDKPTIENVLAELRQQNDELRETLQLMRTELSEDSQRQHNETLEAVRATAQEQVPFNIQGYLDEFSKALATEVRMLLGEVGKLREERRALQHEIGCLLCMRSKYGPDGEFNEGWKPPAAAPTEAPPPESVPAAPEEPIRAPPAWRTVRERGPSRRRRRDQSAPPAAPQPVPTVAPSIPVVTQQGGHTSWATWQPDPTYAPTPPSREPTLLVPEQPSPGLFGPRSPRTSVRQG